MASPPQQLSKIPATEVGEIVQDFITASKKKKVTAEQESGKTTWKIKTD